MKEYLKHKTTILLLIITLCCVVAKVVNILNVSGPDGARYISSGLDSGFHILQNVNKQRAIHEPAQSPVIERITASPNTLWSADKRMVAISLDVSAAPMTGWKVVGVVKNEPESGINDDYDGPDAIFVEQMLKLRAERNRAGCTRTYTVYVRVYNGYSTGLRASTLAMVEVKVPGSQSNGVTFLLPRRAYRGRPPSTYHKTQRSLFTISMNPQDRISNGMDAKLDTGLMAMRNPNANESVSPVNSLQDFVNFDAARRGGQVPQAEANALISIAHEIIQSTLDRQIHPNELIKIVKTA